MENTVYIINITKVPGGATPVIARTGDTVADLISRAFNGESANGYQITVNGAEQTADYSVRQNDNICLARRIKGNI